MFTNVTNVTEMYGHKCNRDVSMFTNVTEMYLWSQM